MEDRHCRDHFINTRSTPATVAQHLIDLHLRQAVFDDGPPFTTSTPRTIADHLSIATAARHTHPFNSLVATVANQTRMISDAIGDCCSKDDCVVSVAGPGNEDDPIIPPATDNLDVGTASVVLDLVDRA